MRRTDAKDSKKRYFRAGDRIVNQNSAWYFSSREGDVGPYSTRTLAEQEVQRFLVERQQLRNFQRSRNLAAGGAAKQVAKPTPKPVGKRSNAVSTPQHAGYDLDQQVESDGLMLTLDENFLI